jgi:hypothetical protein
VVLDGGVRQPHQGAGVPAPPRRVAVGPPW